MKKIYRVQFPGSCDLDFTVGLCHRDYGKVVDIVETTEVSSYDGDNYVNGYNCVVKVIFKDKKEIVFQCSNPLMVIYRENIEDLY